MIMTWRIFEWYFYFISVLIFDIIGQNECLRKLEDIRIRIPSIMVILVLPMVILVIVALQLKDL